MTTSQRCLIQSIIKHIKHLTFQTRMSKSSSIFLFSTLILLSTLAVPALSWTPPKYHAEPQPSSFRLNLTGDSAPLTPNAVNPWHIVNTATFTDERLEDMHDTSGRAGIDNLWCLKENQCFALNNLVTPQGDHTFGFLDARSFFASKTKGQGKQLSWSKPQPVFSRPLNKISCNSKGKCFGVDEKGLIYASRGDGTYAFPGPIGRIQAPFNWSFSYEIGLKYAATISSACGGELCVFTALLVDDESSYYPSMRIASAVWDGKSIKQAKIGKTLFAVYNATQNIDGQMSFASPFCFPDGSKCFGALMFDYQKYRPKVAVYTRKSNTWELVDFPFNPSDSFSEYHIAHYDSSFGQCLSSTFCIQVLWGDDGMKVLVYNGRWWGSFPAYFSPLPTSTSGRYAYTSYAAYIYPRSFACATPKAW